MKLALLTTDNRDMFRQYERPVPWFGTAPQALMQGLAEMPDLEVHVVSCTQQPMAAPEKLSANTFFHSLHVPKIGWLRTGYQGCIRAVRRKLREIGPDIVHGQGTERDCAISAVFSGYPNVITIHGKMTEIAQLTRAPFGSFHWCAARVENFTLPRTDGIICISTYVENLVRRYGVPLWPIPNALQRMFFDFPRSFERRTEPLLVNVGVLSERKRQREILGVLRALRAEGLEFETIFVGSDADGYAAEFKRELAAAAAEFKKFEYIPRLNDEEFCHLFDRASAMVHFSSEESFGLVFAEALTRNLPLFASDVGCIHDIAAGVPDVQIFPLQDWRGLQDALRIWLRQADFNRPKPAAAPEVLVQRYHPIVVAQRHLQVYRDVLARKPGAARG
jgi:glycosyltransferase involved in cell wall biosynthesis